MRGFGPIGELPPKKYQASAGEREAEEFQEEVEAALAQYYYTSFLPRRV
jgi:hypothetical protein